MAWGWQFEHSLRQAWRGHCAVDHLRGAGRAVRDVSCQPHRTGGCKGILDALPAGLGALLLGLMACAALIVLLKTPTRLRLTVAAAGLAAIAVFIGMAAGYLTPPASAYARVSPASGFWILLFSFRPACGRFNHAAAAFAADQSAASGGHIGRYRGGPDVGSLGWPVDPQGIFRPCRCVLAGGRQACDAGAWIVACLGSGRAAARHSLPPGGALAGWCAQHAER